MSRRFPDFITAFETFAETFNSTRHFIKAAGLWMVGTAVGRAVAMEARGNSLSPNFFFEMVGGPGTGKSQAVKAVREIFVPATKMSIIPASVTRAGLEDYMQNNLQQRRTPDGAILLSNECIGLSEEMQGILPDQDLGHLTLYNILYDLPHKHVAVTRTSGEKVLEAPYCSILTGAQPAFLATTMPEQAWGMGFMSRSIMVFDTPRARTSMFEFSRVDNKMKADLIHDLKVIHNLCGWMKWTRDAQLLYQEWWVQAGGLPIPQAKRLAMGYNSRRELHMVKLAMAFSLSRSDSLVVEVTDVGRAIEQLLLFEDRMKMIFAEMSNTGAMVAIEDALDLVRIAAADGQSLPEGQLIELLMQRFPPTQVQAVINNMLNSGAIELAKGSMAALGLRKFVPGKKVALL